MHANITKHTSGTTDENGSKIVPKPLQNRSWRGSGELLGDSLETRCFQDFIFDDVDSLLGPPLGPVWAHVGHRVFFYVFLRWLFDSLGFHLGSQNTSKMKPKRRPTPKAEIHWYSMYLQHLSHIQGSWKWLCVVLCWNSFLGSLLEPILATSILAHFWGPFWRHFS